jgi:hypothetical protein
MITNLLDHFFDAFKCSFNKFQLFQIHFQPYQLKHYNLQNYVAKLTKSITDKSKTSVFT